jgi:hypothetical protein
VIVCDAEPAPVPATTATLVPLPPRGHEGGGPASTPLLPSPPGEPPSPSPAEAPSPPVAGPSELLDESLAEGLPLSKAPSLPPSTEVADSPLEQLKTALLATIMHIALKYDATRSPYG